MVTYIALHLLELIEHLLAPVVLEYRLGCNLRVLDEGETGWLYLVLLVVHNISQVDSLTSLLLFVLLSLLDRGETWLLAVELAHDVWLVHRLILLTLLLKGGIESVNLLTVRSVSTISKLDRSAGPRHSR